MRQTAKVTVSYDGNSLSSKAGSSSLYLGGLIPQADNGTYPDGSVVITYRSEPSRISTTLIHVRTTDLDAIKNAQGATVLYTTDTNLAFTMSNAVAQVGELRDGEVEVTFIGQAIPKPTDLKS